MDWNGDGKHDWKDDAIFHNVINSSENSNDKNTNTHQQKPNIQTGAAGGLAINLLCMGYLSVLLPGDIPINTFTMLIGLVCAGRLGYCLLRWLYS